MKILVTGGAGYIGSALTLALAKLDTVTDILVYDNLSRNEFGLFTAANTHLDKVKLVRANILDNHSLHQAMQGVDVVYHLAAKVIAPDSDTDSQYFEQVNNWGTAAVVHEAKKAKVKQFVYVSSVYVYGQGADVMTTADEPTPNSFYGISKLRGEDHVKTLPKTIDTYIVRSGSVYGFSPATRFDVLINKLIFESHFFKKIAIHGEGNQIRPFIHLHKLVAILTKLSRDAISPGIYNAVEHNASINEILDSILSIYPDVEYNHVNRHLRMKDIIVKPSDELASLSVAKTTFVEELQAMENKLW